MRNTNGGSKANGLNYLDFTDCYVNTGRVTHPWSSIKQVCQVKTRSGFSIFKLLLQMDDTMECFNQVFSPFFQKKRNNHESSGFYKLNKMEAETFMEQTVPSFSRRKFQTIFGGSRTYSHSFY